MTKAAGTKDHSKDLLELKKKAHQAAKKQAESPEAAVLAREARKLLKRAQRRIRKTKLREAKFAKKAQGASQGAK